jgi:MFS family permease
MNYITKTVWILSLVSFFTDAASEMLYPIMPIYLKTIGFSVLLIGILEGLAEATAGLSKGYFGKLSDLSGRRVPFVQVGYALSSISKPLMAIFTYPLWIFGVRTLDRFGKGIRTGARDAILSNESTKETKGKVFGFHRSMDTFGAVVGPLLALVYLYYYPGNYKTLFIMAFIPGLLAVLSSMFLKESKVVKTSASKNVSFFSFLNYWKVSTPQYRKLVTGLLIFTLFNSSDVFLLLKAKQDGLGDAEVIGLYIFYNLVYAFFAFPMGILGDKIGLKTIFLFGIFIFSVVYFGMAVSGNLLIFIGLFFLYGIYGAASEGISKAWISLITQKTEIATAIGTYTGLQSICTMLASTLTGFVWFQYGAATAFIGTSFVAFGLVFYFTTIPAPISVDA